jgi:hypothetical protein
MSVAARIARLESAQPSDQLVIVLKWLWPSVAPWLETEGWRYHRHEGEDDGAMIARVSAMYPGKALLTLKWTGPENSR